MFFAVQRMVTLRVGACAWHDAVMAWQFTCCACIYTSSGRAWRAQRGVKQRARLRVEFGLTPEQLLQVGTEM